MRDAFTKVAAVLLTLAAGCAAETGEDAAPAATGGVATGGHAAAGAGGGSAAGAGGSSATGGRTAAGGSSATDASSGAGGSNATAGSDARAPLPAADGAPGVWQEVTPPGMDLDTSWGGVQTVLADPARPTDVYANADSEGTWRSTDYGLTWTKQNTGTHAGEVDSGRQWYAAIELNPARDPATDPVIYVTLGYGTNSVWRSSNRGVDWDKAWNTIYAPDGTTDISSDVGGDIHSVHIIDERDPNHLIVSLHSYWGTGNNNGVFESTDGGQTYVVHKSQTFNFQPHADLLFPYDAKTWLVAHSTTWPDSDLYRTTDAGASWTVVDHNRFIGRQIAKVGSAIYASGSKFSKSTDQGATWATIPSGVNDVWGIAAIGQRLYITGGNPGNENDTSAHKIRWAPLSADGTWTDLPPQTGLEIHAGGGGARNPGWLAVTSDGTHDIIIVSNKNAGLWRYVQP